MINVMPPTRAPESNDRFINLAVFGMTLLIGVGCCSIIAWALTTQGFSRTDALLGALIYAVVHGQATQK